MQNDRIDLYGKVTSEAELSEKGFKAVLKTGAVALTADIAYVLERKFLYGNEKFNQTLVGVEIGAIGAVGTMATAFTVFCGAYTLFHEVKGLVLWHKHKKKIMQKENED